LSNSTSKTKLLTVARISAVDLGNRARSCIGKEIDKLRHYAKKRLDSVVSHPKNAYDETVAGMVVLKGEASIQGQESVELKPRAIEKFPILNRAPAHFGNGNHLMPDQVSGKLRVEVLVEENSH